MEEIQYITQYWKDVAEQNEEALLTYFQPDAYINWHNTNEHFTVAEFIIANCEYPGNWVGKIERIQQLDELVICIVHISELKAHISFHVTSFIQFQNHLIQSIDEYWGDDGEAPQWRKDKHLGTRIK